jgi:HlyD family secretion protein
MRKFLTKKKIIWTVIILLVLGFAGSKIFKGKNPADKIVAETVTKQNLKRTVLATGQVVSQTDLGLSFKVSGFVSKLNVKEGDKVKQGDILATLDQKDQAASLTSARGSLAQAEASYQKIIAGASNEDVVVSQTALDNAGQSLENTKKQQVTFVANAYNALLNSSIAAVPGLGNIGSLTAVVTGAYTGQDQGVYQISVYATGSGLRFKVAGLEGAEGVVDTTPQPLGRKGLYLQFPDKNIPTNNTWTVTIPNTSAANYVANYNAYQAALQAQQVAVDAAQAQVNSAQAALNLKKAQARPADIAAAQAQILSAQGQVQAAQAALENTIIRAPVGGTITSVDIKTGELASALKEAIILQDVNNLHVEANISEANVADLKMDQTVDLTFDSLGPDRHFKGTLQTVNPASTVVSGVVDYKVTASLEKVEEIKPGMTANMIILVGQKDSALAVPQRAILNKDNGQKAVRVIDNPQKKTYHEVTVITGMEADGGLVEITSGLNEGQEIVTLIKP